MNTHHGSRHGTRASRAAIDGARLIRSFTVSFMLAVAFACAGGSSSGGSGKKKQKQDPSDVARSVPSATRGVAAPRHRLVATALGDGGGAGTVPLSLARSERR